MSGYECDKLINKYILRARKFIEYGCFQYGKCSYAIGKKPTADFISDFQYFVLTKSTKSLESIRTLLDIGHTEDVLVLARTMFEGYLASRYICEQYNDDLLNDFIFIPQLIAQRKVVYENEAARIRETNEVIPFFQRNPSQMKLGKDKKYFYNISWQTYVQLCRAYEHTIYITNVSKTEAEDTTELNYQFLNTVKMLSSEFRPNDLPLGWEHSPSEDERMWLTKPTEQRYYDLRRDTDARIRYFTDKADEWTFGRKSRSYHLAELLRKNPKFINELYFVRQLDDAAESFLKDYSIGRLLVDGDNRFFAADIMELFYELIRENGGKPDIYSDIRNENWHFMKEDERYAFLIKHLPEEEYREYYDIFADFRFGGYKLLPDIITETRNYNISANASAMQYPNDSEELTLMVKAYLRNPVGNYRETVSKEAARIIETRILSFNASVKYIVALGKRDFLYDAYYRHINRFARKGDKSYD